jgi:hypothetical protein
VGSANSDVSRELGFRDAWVGTVALLLPLLRKHGAATTCLPDVVPLHPTARPTSPTHRLRRQVQRPKLHPPTEPCSPRSAACCPDPVGVILRPARDAVVLALAAGRRRLDLPASPDRPAAAGPGGAAADRPPGQGEPPLGRPTDQRRAPTAWRARLGDRDPHHAAPPRTGSSATADGHHLAGVPAPAGRRDRGV